jgi:hypothetical protein
MQLEYMFEQRACLLGPLEPQETDSERLQRAGVIPIQGQRVTQQRFRLREPAEAVEVRGRYIEEEGMPQPLVQSGSG